MPQQELLELIGAEPAIAVGQGLASFIAISSRQLKRAQQEQEVGMEFEAPQAMGQLMGQKKSSESKQVTTGAVASSNPRLRAAFAPWRWSCFT